LKVVLNAIAISFVVVYANAFRKQDSNTCFMAMSYFVKSRFN
jgi:hypothetical protein